jgi:hypothetical protein
LHSSRTQCLLPVSPNIFSLYVCQSYLHTIYLHVQIQVSGSQCSVSYLERQEERPLISFSKHWGKFATVNIQQRATSDFPALPFESTTSSGLCIPSSMSVLVMFLSPFAFRLSCLHFYLSVLYPRVSCSCFFCSHFCTTRIFCLRHFYLHSLCLQ